MHVSVFSFSNLADQSLYKSVPYKPTLVSVVPVSCTAAVTCAPLVECVPTHLPTFLQSGIKLQRLQEIGAELCKRILTKHSHEGDHSLLPRLIPQDLQVGKLVVEQRTTKCGPA